MRLVVRLLLALGCLIFVLPVAAAWRDGNVSQAVKLTSGVLLALGAVRPAWGLSVLALLVPFSPSVAAYAQAPMGSVGVAETFVASFLLSAGLGAAFGRQQVAIGLKWPALVFGALVAIAGGLGLVVRQQVTTWPGDFLRRFGQHLATAYFNDTPDYGAFRIAVAWLEAIALAVVAERVTRARRGWPTALLAGTAAAAATGWRRLFEISLRRPDPLTAAIEFLRTLRIQTLFTDANAAGSLFALSAVPAVWLAWRSRRAHGEAAGSRVARRIAYGLAAVLILVALWMTQSRAAYAGTIVGVSAVWIVSRRLTRRGLVSGAAIAGALLLYLVFLNSASVTQVSAGQSMGIRVEMAKIAWQITRQSPAFGIGLGAFKPASRGFITPDLRRNFPATENGENAHNNFLQILAELGVAGLVAFVWLLAAAGRSAYRTWRDPPTANRETHLSLAGGALAFLVTCLAGHPFLTNEVLWSFFLTLGVVAGLGPSLAGATAAWPRRAGPVLLAVVLASGVVRLWQVRHGDLHRSAVGVSGWMQLDGERYRLAAERSTWFVPAGARLVLMPLRLTDDSPDGCAVHVNLDGNPANTVIPTSAGWLPLAIQLVPDRERVLPRRIELRVERLDCHLMVGDVQTRE